MKFLFLVALVLTLSIPVATAQTLAVYEITRTSLELTQNSIESGNNETAIEHIIFASDFFAANSIRTGNADTLDGDIHLALLDTVTFVLNDDTKRAKESIRLTIELLQSAQEQPGPNDYSEILAVAEKHYREGIIYEAPSSTRLSLDLVSYVAQHTSNERIDSLLAQMQTGEADYRHIADSIAYIQRTVFGAASVEINDSHLYHTIDQLYERMLEQLDSGNYDAASESAVEAYLDNFEYLEPSIVSVNEPLMLELETAMRETLRGQIRDGASVSDIRTLVEQNITPNLAHAQEITAGLSSQSVVTSTLAEPGQAMARMGSASAEQKETVRGEIDDIREKLQLVDQAHSASDYDTAYEIARSAYLDSYELIEIPLRVISPDFTLEVETEFAELRNVVRDHADPEIVRTAIVKIERSLEESERLVSGTGYLAPLIAFSSSFAIIFREGLESVLILGAILTYLEATRNTRFKSHLMYGVLGGIAATGLTWIAAQYIIDISGASREVIEAIAALSATAVLFYVSFWVLNKIEHKKWMEFVKAKVWQATTTGSATVFVMLSFFTIYREGFETVLFYQAMIAYARYSELYVVLGLILGLASLFAIYYVIRRLGRKLPLRALFGLTMGVGAYLSIAFLGNAVRELQLLDVLPYTSMLGTIPRLDINVATLTGIYPTLETTIAQFVLLSIYLVASSYVLIMRPRRVARLAAMHKSRKDA